MRPPRDHTSEAMCDGSPIEMTPIGIARCPYKERFGTPRQATIETQVAGGKAQEGELRLFAPYREHTLRGLAGFDYVWVIYRCHLNTGWRPLVQPPRGPKARQGVFATRAPHRPNQLGLSALRVVGVDERAGVVRVRGLDLLDGTPVLDIKPYVRHYDSFPSAKAGWIDELPDEPQGPDRLGYWPPPKHIQ